ncbi:MAG: PLP-dependent aminotransferase family protein [Rhizobiales bacterium]|nr:PLP-dependent aminotransferase family protein [Hyphomicrobiales bacterium]
MTANAFDFEACFASRAERMQASEIRELLKLLAEPDIISFAGGIPDPALFPGDALAKAFASATGDAGAREQAFQYSPSEGYAPLREWIAGYMTELGAPCEAGNILITNGSQQALDFLGRLFLSPRDTALVMAPTYLGALQAFSAYEPHFDALELQPAANSPAGYRDRAETKGGAVKFAYAVPDFSNPTGVTMTSAERQLLLDTGHELDIPVIEDGAYTALRYDGEPVPSLLAMDVARSGSIEAARTIFCGTFSKTMVPGLRVGWVCAARPLIEKLVLIKQASDLHSASLNQVVMHEVAKDIFDDQLGRIRAAYQERRDAMLAALEAYMPGGVTWHRPEGGMFVWLTLPEGWDAKQLLARSIAEARVAFVPGGAFFADGSGANTARLSFSLADPKMIDEGISRLGKLFSNVAGPGASR